MQIEVEIPADRECIPIISFDTDIIDPNIGLNASIGYKHFTGEIGSFQYEWIMEYMSIDELKGMREALTFVLDQLTQEEDGNEQ
jgi:hypothetical protein